MSYPLPHRHRLVGQRRRVDRRRRPHRQRGRHYQPPRPRSHGLPDADPGRDHADRRSLWADEARTADRDQHRPRPWIGHCFLHSWTRRGSPVTKFQTSCVSTDGGVNRSTNGTESPITVTAPDRRQELPLPSAGHERHRHQHLQPLRKHGHIAPSAPAQGSVTGLTPLGTAARVDFSLGHDGGSPITSVAAQCVSTDGGVGRTTNGDGSSITRSLPDQPASTTTAVCAPPMPSAPGPTARTVTPSSSPPPASRTGPR